MRSVALVFLLAACGGEAVDPDYIAPEPINDVDGNGKEDGVSSASDTHLVDIPFYFALPREAVTVPLERSLYPYPTVWNTSLEVEELGLRIIAVKQTANTVTAKKTARRDMATKLARAGVLRDGDVVLTFRPELAGTMAYPHIQMGTTHAGLVYVQNGVAYNIDSPLDSSYMGRFDAPHYAGNGTDDAGTDALHIVRPRVMDDARRRARLVDWIGKLKRALPRINGERAQVKFQSDYLTPIYVARGLTTKQTVTLLGKIILEVDQETLLPMYCSELAWHMIALSGCTADQIRAAPAEGADCVSEAFAPLPMVSAVPREVGLTEGPLLALMEAPAEERETLGATIFADGDPGRLSSGHRAVAEQVAPLMPSLAQLFQARASGLTLEQTAPAAGMLNAPFPRNYSPTSFLVESMVPAENRAVDYVVTIAFVDAAGYTKAQRLARNPVP